MSTALPQLLASSKVRWAVGGWIFFIAENAILSENRTFLIQQFGNEPYHAFYGTLSTAATGSIAYAYYKIRNEAAATVAAKAPPPPRIPALMLSWACMSLGLVMASQSLPKLQIPVALTTTKSSSSSSSLQLPQQNPEAAPNTETTTTSSNREGTASTAWKLQVRCPFDFTDQHDHSQTDQIRGLDRISRHPGLWSLGLVGAGNACLLVSSSSSSSSLSALSLLPLQLWWMGPMAVAWLGGMHSDSRFRRGMGGNLDPIYESQTSNVPFAAIVTGRQGNPIQVLQQLLIGQELKPLNAALATGMATLFVFRRRGRIRV